MHTLISRSGPAIATPQPPLEVVVLFTTMAETRSALEAASALAHGLSARVRLLVAQVVPFPLPLSEPVRQARLSAKRYHPTPSWSSELAGGGGSWAPDGSGGFSARTATTLSSPA